MQDIQDNFVLRRERSDQIDKRRIQYKWLLFPGTGIPSGIDDSVSNLPTDEQFSVVKNIDFAKAGIKAITTLGFKGLVLKIDSLYDYISLAKSLEDNDLSVYDKIYEGSRWVTDVEFGRQMLNGVNPVVIRKCTKLPSNFPVTNEMVHSFFNREEAGGDTIPDLKQQMAVSSIRIIMSSFVV